MRIIVIFVFIFLQLSNCSKEDLVSSPIDSSILVPLNIGNTWKYKLENDNIIIDRVDSTLSIDSITGYWLNTDMGTWTAQKVVYNTPEGFYIDNRLYIGNDNHQHVFIYHCTEGMKWTNTFNFMGMTIESHYEVLSISERIELSCGVFNCCVYKVYSNDTHYEVGDSLYQSYSKYYFAPGIGQVLQKEVITDESFIPLENYDEVVSKELIEYEIIS